MRVGRRAKAAPAARSTGSSGGTVRTVHGRLRRVSVAASMRAAAWAGFVLGLALGAPLGAGVAWVSGALLSWQRDLGFTLGVSRSLLPFGDQIGVLRTISANWALVVPGVALGTAAVGAILAAIVGGILAAAYNTTGGHASVEVELEEAELEAVVEAEAEAQAAAAPEPVVGRAGGSIEPPDSAAAADSAVPGRTTPDIAEPSGAGDGRGRSSPTC